MDVGPYMMRIVPLTSPLLVVMEGDADLYLLLFLFESFRSYLCASVYLRWPKKTRKYDAAMVADEG